MEYILLLCFVISFLVTLIVIPIWIRRARKAGLVGKDMNKLNGRDVAEIGGICVVAGFIFGILTYIAIETFYFHNTSRSLQIMAVLSSILIIAIIGLIDDILGWKIGLRQWQKPILTLFAALPIIVINAGDSTMVLPFLGRVDIGVIYTLVFIPIGIMGATNGFNLLAGYNGLEAGIGVIILSALGFVTWRIGVPWVAIIALCMVFALIAFLLFNKYPAKIFPGDTLTYSVGALIACIAILGDTERIAIILFLPFFIELFIKARYKFRGESFSIPQADGSIKAKIPVQSLTHVVILFLSKLKKKVYERDVIYAFIILEIILVILTLSLINWIP